MNQKNYQSIEIKAVRLIESLDGSSSKWKGDCCEFLWQPARQNLLVIRR